MRLNTAPKNTAVTHEGAPAAKMNAMQALRRSVLACLLWEDSFYESGEEIGARIASLAVIVPPEELAALAIEAREKQNLWHVPLLLLSVLAHTGKGKSLVRQTIERVIQRSDELAEFLVIHAKMNGVTPDKLKSKLSAQMKRGLASAFRKFDSYQLSKYDRAGAVRLRDVLFLVHPKPVNDEQQALWNQLVKNELAVPDTWETELSAGKDKKETFERLIRERKLGYFALIRNLRNMVEAGVDETLVNDAIIARKGGVERVLPFRFVSAVSAAPTYAKALSVALLAAVKTLPPLPGKTIVMVDTSGSMQSPLSAKSKVQRVEAAASLAALINGDVRLFQFASGVEEVPFFPGLAGIETVRGRIGRVGHGTDIGLAVEVANRLPHDRLIVISDEQSMGRVPDPVAKRAYMINVAAYQNGVGYGRWVHLDGFSEAVLKWIAEYELAMS